MKFQLIGPLGMSVNHMPRSSVPIGQRPFSITTQIPAAGEPSAWRIVPMTRVLPGVIVAPGVGNGVVPGGTGVASAGVFVGLGLSVGVGLELGVGGGTAAAVHAATTMPMASRASLACFITPMFGHRAESPVARPPST